MTQELATGSYLLEALDTSTGLGYLGQVYDGIPCPPGCDVTAGSPITITLATDSTGIDFTLEQGSAISGTGTDATTGLALQDIRVDVDDSNGIHATTCETGPDGGYTSAAGLPVQAPEVLANAEIWLLDATGAFVAAAPVAMDGSYRLDTIEPGTYSVRTYSWQGWIDEVFNDVPCPVGSGCDLGAATPIVCDWRSRVTGIDFALSTTPDLTPPQGPGTLFSSTHETGVWSQSEQLEISWSGASDGESRVLGYSLLLDSSPALADGTWYLHLCATDAAGNWGPVSTAGPVAIFSEQLFSDGFESANLDLWSAHVPMDNEAVSR